MVSTVGKLQPVLGNVKPFRKPIFHVPNSTPESDFARRLRKARREMGEARDREVLLKEMAAAVGQKPVTVGRWVSGEREPDFESTGKLAAFLGVNPAWLAFGIGPMHIQGKGRDGGLVADAGRPTIRAGRADS